MGKVTLSVLVIILLLIVLVYIVHALQRIKNGHWVVNSLMSEYNYSEDLACQIVMQIDNMTKCKILRKDKENFLQLAKEFILKMTSDEPII